jgi:hypothetical protein
VILYKYCGPGGIDILHSGRVMLARARGFNDPFELNPHITGITDDISYARHIAERIKNYVILSLADNRESLLMWAHYAASHSGFLIGFDADREILAEPSSHRDFGPVVYSHSKPTKPTFDDVSNLELFYWKSSEWVYEREWRIIDSAFSAAGEPSGPRGDHLPFIFRPDSVKEVIYGCRCSIQADLQAVLRESRYAHVSLVAASMDREQYKLNFIEFPRSDWEPRG